MKSAMKPIYTFVLVCITITGLVRCGKNDDKNGSEQMNASCYFQQRSGYSNGTACNYPYQSIQGFSQAQASNSQYQYQSSMMSSCIQGSQLTVYSPTKGVGCIQSNLVGQGGNPAVYTLNQATGTFTLQGPLNGYNNGYNAYNGYNQYPQNYTGYNNYQPNYNNYASNSVSVLRVCDSSEKCPSGQACRSPLQYNNSGIGICYY